MNEKYIQTMLMRTMLARRHVAVITNSNQTFMYEADLLTVTGAGLVNEFEIKCTRSDYNREFKTHSKKNKHHWLEHVYGASYIPNYFWFVTYLFEIEPPEYAGWILVQPVTFDSKYPDGVPHELVTKKRAPRLHALKWDDAKVAKIARLLSYRLLKEFERETGLDGNKPME